VVKGEEGTNQTTSMYISWRKKNNGFPMHDKGGGERGGKNMSPGAIISRPGEGEKKMGGVLTVRTGRRKNVLSRYRLRERINS